MAVALLIASFIACSACQQFSLPSPSRSADLQADVNFGKVYVSAGNSLYRLNSNFVLEERLNLTNGVVNISLSTNGRWLIVCLTDLSCEVYNATNLAAHSVFRRENVIKSTENVALFAVEDSFYVGSVLSTRTGIQQQIALGQYTFAENEDHYGIAESGLYPINATSFERNMYGGFVRGDYAYYFAVDNGPTDTRSLRVQRVCSNSNFAALYELSLFCSIPPNSTTRISGVSIVEDFAGRPGSTVVLSINQPQSSKHYVCLFDLDSIDSIMGEKYSSCVSETGQIKLAWQSHATSCSTQQFTVSYLMAHS